MKMNKFRTNLHPAFFINGNDSNENIPDSMELELNFDAEINGLKDNVLRYFRDYTENYIDKDLYRNERILSYYRDSGLGQAGFNKDKEKFNKRLNDEKDGKTYRKILNERIGEGLGLLLGHLKNQAKYFEGMSPEQVNKEKARITNMYWEEVERQYIDEIRFAREKKYKDKMDRLFTKDTPEAQAKHPANKIYKKLAGAPLFAVERFDREGYGDLNVRERDKYKEVSVKEQNEAIILTAPAAKDLISGLGNREGVNVVYQNDKGVELGQIETQTVVVQIKEGDDVKKEIRVEVTIEEGDNKGYKMTVKPAAAQEAAQQEQQETIETGIDNETLTSEDREFLSNKLPFYLRGVRKTPGNLKWLPFIKIESKTPSKIERKAIDNFLEVSTKVKWKNSYQGEYKDKTVALLNAFRNISENTGEKLYKEKLGEYGLEPIKDKYMDDIMEAGKFYAESQDAFKNQATGERNVPLDKQYVIYLSVLEIIENAGSPKNAINLFRDRVEKSNNKKGEKERKEAADGTKLGKIDSILYGFAQALSIDDFTSATNLAERHTSYFDNHDIGHILADLDNDGFVNVRDVTRRSSKSGPQFLNIYERLSKTLGEDKVLENLLNYAKIRNASLYYKDEQGNDAYWIKDNEFTHDQIQKGNKKLILLLQNIISNPGQDLQILLSGQNGKQFEGRERDLQDMKSKYNRLIEEAKNKSKEAADKIIKKQFKDKFYEKKKKELSKQGVVIDDNRFAQMQEQLAVALETNYKNGLGFGSNLSFDEWIKGLNIGVGYQIREGASDILGLNISYNKDFYIGKGWTVTPGISGGLFIDVAEGPKNTFANLGINLVIDREVVNFETGRVTNYGIDAGGDVATLSLYAGWHRRRDEIEGIPEAAAYQKNICVHHVMFPITSEIAEYLRENGNESVMDLSSSGIKTKVQEIINKTIEGIKDIPQHSSYATLNKEGSLDFIWKMLANYNNTNFKTAGIEYGIADEISGEIARLWAESRKDTEIRQNWQHSGHSLGALFGGAALKLEGSLLGGYGSDSESRYRNEGNGDIYGRQHRLEHEYAESHNDKTLQYLNDLLGLSEGGLKIEQKGDTKYVKIPKDLAYRVNVDSRMLEYEYSKKYSIGTKNNNPQKVKINVTKDGKTEIVPVEVVVKDGNITCTISDGYTSTLGVTAKQGIDVPTEGDVQASDLLALDGADIDFAMDERTKQKVSLIGKDNAGNFLLDVYTPLGTELDTGSSSNGSELFIGGGKDAKFVKLNELKDRQVIKIDVGETINRDGGETINRDGVLELVDRMSEITPESLVSALDDLIRQFPGDREFVAYAKKLRAEDPENENSLFKELVAKRKENPGRGISVKIKKQSDGNFAYRFEEKQGAGIEIVYETELEMIDSKAQEIANQVYNRAVNTNGETLNKLYKVKHPNPSNDYLEFTSNLKVGNKDNYEKAKNIVTKILNGIYGEEKVSKLAWPERNDYLIAENPEDPTDKENARADEAYSAALAQSLYSINNLFARGVSVKGGRIDNEKSANLYEFDVNKYRNMGKIIERREGKEISGVGKEGIRETINKSSIDNEIKLAYKKLFKAARLYRIKKPDFFDKSEAHAKSFANTVGFNLGDKENPENPLFNPEIYESVVDFNDPSVFNIENGYDTDKMQALKAAKDKIHEHAMRKFVENKALISPILNVLGYGGKNATVRDNSFDIEGERGTLSLDIKDEKDNIIDAIQVSSEMFFGYYTQCVNHMVVLSNIVVKRNGQEMKFESGAIKDGIYREGIRTRRVGKSTVTVGLSYAKTRNRGGGNEENKGSGVGDERTGGENSNDQFNSDF